MSDRFRRLVVPAILISSVARSGLMMADEHADQAVKHAQEAAGATDSKSIGEHAAQALEHLEAAKAGADAKSREHLKQGEADLNNAVQQSQWHNTGHAAQEAADGTTHLEQAAGK